jgi:hypothetical protein
MPAHELLVVLSRAQPEHAIGESCPTGATENYRDSCDPKRPAKVVMTIDEEPRNAETAPQNYAQDAIQPPHI